MGLLRARQASTALQKRLSHRNPNVQIYALEVSLESLVLMRVVEWRIKSVADVDSYNPINSSPIHSLRIAVKTCSANSPLATGPAR